MAGLKTMADAYENKLSELTPDYQKKNYSSGPCYIATAVYGSYDCPEVWTLRRFRDYTLAETWYGRAFISTYYAISPTLVKWFGKSEIFKRFVLFRLTNWFLNFKPMALNPRHIKTATSNYIYI